MSLLKDQVTKYNSDKNRITVAYDLSLNQSMYCVPKEIIKNLELRSIKKIKICD